MDENQVNQGAIHPRASIRSFLQTLLKQMGMEEEYVEQWPHVSAELYHQYHHILADGHRQYCLFLEKQDNVDEEIAFYTKLYGEVAVAFFELDWQQPHWTEEAWDTSIFEGRPKATLALNQQFCTPQTTFRRVHRMMQNLAPGRDKVLFLGDDDLGSVALASQFSGDIHMLDLDERLLDFIAEKAPQVHRHTVDLDAGMPKTFHEAFDAVMLDPHWFYGGAKVFLEKAVYCLKQTPEARLYMSLCPLFTGEEITKLHNRIHSLGLLILELRPFFNWYDLSLLDSPNARDMIGELTAQYPSSLVDSLRPLPYGFSHFYVLARAPGFKHNPIKKWFFDTWQSV